jgi:CRP-like cAMP-binding protein
MLLQGVTDTRIQFKPHEFLAREGSLPEAIFRIEEGWACRFRLLSDGRRQITALYLPGDLCEPHWAWGVKPTQPIVALTPVRATGLARQPQGTSSPEQTRAILCAMGEALERQSKWLVTLGRGTALERVASLVRDVYDRMEKAGMTCSLQCAMPLTQTDMADLTGLTPVHVNRTLQMMRAKKLIELESRMA